MTLSFAKLATNANTHVNPITNDNFKFNQNAQESRFRLAAEPFFFTLIYMYGRVDKCYDIKKLNNGKMSSKQ